MTWTHSKFLLGSPLVVLYLTSATSLVLECNNKPARFSFSSTSSCNSRQFHILRNENPAYNTNDYNESDKLIQNFADNPS